MEPLQKGWTYHIYNRGNNRGDIFFEKENYEYFLTLIKKYLLPVSEIYAYCLLKNHYHLLLRIKEDAEIKKDRIHQPFSNLFNAYAKAINKRYGRDGSLFKKNFSRKSVTDDDYLNNLVLYIHLNPVKHGFSVDVQNYPYTSFHTLIADNETWLERDFIINRFGDKENFIYCHKGEIEDLPGFKNLEGL